MLWEAIKLASTSIRRNALRSVLTLLGIVIGVGAVIAMVTIGTGASQKVQENLAKLGSNMLIVRAGQSSFGPGSNNDARSFEERDVAALKANLSGVRGVAPSAQRNAKAVYGALNYDTSITGTTSDYFIVQDWTLRDGRVFTEGEERSGTTVCVIGSTIVKELFGSADPLGQRLRIGNFACEVIGLLDSKGQSAFGSDQDSVVLLPLRTYHRRLAGNTRISSINISVTEAADIPRVQRDAEDVLRERRRVAPGEDDNFTVRDMTQIANTMAATTSVLTGLLGAVAAVSLLVGGIGIMNIMLVSVTERTREIGLRMAVGARSRDILTQFLVEAVTLALIGGLLGVALGFGGSLAIGNFAGWRVEIDPDAVLLAVGFAAAIGVFFGFYPARKASKLLPIEALRYE